MPEHLISILLLGLIGSIHCVGMCGGFALMVAQTSGNRRGFLIGQVFYYLGKTTTYMILGSIVGGFGALITHAFSGIQQTLSMLLGLVFILVGAGLIGWLKGMGSTALLARWKPLTSAMGRLMKEKTRAATFGLGVLNGLLPCGLVYGALAIAVVSGSALSGALYMGAFGLATIPALFTLASLGTVMRPLWRHRLHQVSGVIVMLLGIITMLRGLPGGHGM